MTILLADGYRVKIFLFFLTSRGEPNFWNNVFVLRWQRNCWLIFFPFSKYEYELEIFWLIDIFLLFSEKWCLRWKRSGGRHIICLPSKFGTRWGQSTPTRGHSPQTRINHSILHEVKEVGSFNVLQKISARRQSSQWPSHNQFIFLMVGSE